MKRGDGMSGVRREAVHAVRGDMAAASDAKLIQIVAMVDALPERGVADRLLATLRPRLAELRPARPLRFARLLFLPLDPMIVPPARWTPGALGIPRSAVGLLAEAVRAAMGTEARDVAAMIAGHSTADMGVIAAAGAILWPAAAQMLSGAAIPAGWARSGLPDARFTPLATLAADLLRPAARIEPLLADTRRGLAFDWTGLREILAATEALGPDAWRAVIALLLLRLPDPGMLLREIGGESRRANTAMRAAAEQGVDAALAKVADLTESGALLAARGAADMSDELGRIADLLDQVEAAGAGPDRRSRIGAIRQRVDLSCRRWLAGQLQGALVARLHDVTGDAEIIAMEQTTRDLCAMHQQARRFGSGEKYDRLLHQAGAALANEALGGVAGVVDRARLLELLVGPDAALAFMEAIRATEMAPV